MSITRRLFIVGTAATTTSAPLWGEPQAEAAPSPREQAIWHMRELQRLSLESGSLDCCIFVAEHFSEYVEGQERDVRTIGLWDDGAVRGGGLFEEGRA